MEARGGRFGFGAQRRVEGHQRATPGLAVEKRAFRHRLAQHFFEAQRLGADLHFVAPVGFGMAALVFDGVGRGAVEFDDVRLADEAQPQRPQRQIPRDAHIAANFVPGGMDMVVSQPPFGRETVLAPGLFDVDQRALPLAIQQVLQGGKGQEVVF